MQRAGADPMDMQVSDFLCDFCVRAWDGAFPMVEGHQGSLICDRCLEVAYRELVLAKGDSTRVPYHCTMCLEERSQPGWTSPMVDGKAVCLRCVNQAAVRLERDEDWQWARPS